MKEAMDKAIDTEMIGLIEKDKEMKELEVIQSGQMEDMKAAILLTRTHQLEELLVKRKRTMSSRFWSMRAKCTDSRET